MERRTHRSEDPYEALCLQLEHSRANGDLGAMVVTIDNGLLVAGAGSRALCEALGAVAPMIDEPSLDGRMPRVLEGQRIDVRSLSVLGETLFVASVGNTNGQSLWLQRSINGVRRILGQAA